jgi:hypothetical protein
MLPDLVTVKYPLAALKARGVRFLDRRTMRITRTRLRDTFAKLEARGDDADREDGEGDAPGVDLRRRDQPAPECGGRYSLRLRIRAV